MQWWARSLVASLRLAAAIRRLSGLPAVARERFVGNGKVHSATYTGFSELESSFSELQVRFKLMNSFGLVGLAEPVNMM